MSRARNELLATVTVDLFADGTREQQVTTYGGLEAWDVRVLLFSIRTPTSDPFADLMRVAVFAHMVFHGDFPRWNQVFNELRLAVTDLADDALLREMDRVAADPSSGIRPYHLPGEMYRYSFDPFASEVPA